MKIILSRKGFDASTGKVPSPIFPSGFCSSLPIPEAAPTQPPLCYAELRAGAYSMGEIVQALTQGKITPATPAHLDPDLDALSKPRPPGWQPLFGQAGAAEGHLQKCGVQAGDIFLFYGWFKQVGAANGIYRYVPTAPDIHLIFGWLQIERRLPVAERAALPAWALDHVHCRRSQPQRLDSLYLSTDQVKLPGFTLNRPGAGVFGQAMSSHCLTAPDARHRSIWQLPAWFHPAGRRSCLSYHATLSRWTKQADGVRLQSVGRGQEFILDCADYPEAIDWIAGLLSG